MVEESGLLVLSSFVIIIIFIYNIFGIMFQQSFRGKQLHHLIYKRKVKEIQDFSQCEKKFSISFLFVPICSFMYSSLFVNCVTCTGLFFLCGFHGL